MNFNFKKYGSWRLCQNLNYSTSSLCRKGNAVLFLNCTNKVIKRCGLEKKHLAKGEASSAKLGNWYVTIFEADGINIFLYMSEKTFLSFVMFEGQKITPQKLSTAFLGGLQQLLKMLGYKLPEIAKVESEYAQGLFCGVDNLSMAGVLTNMAQEYRWHIEDNGGLSYCDLGAIIEHVNSMPRKKLGFRSATELTKEVIETIAT